MTSGITTRLVACLLGLAVLLLAAGCGGKHLECAAGETDCGGRCVSLLTDPDNCGACGVAAGALQVCRAGALACAPGVATCDGACTDLARDAGSCGACGHACGSGQLCSTAGGGTCIDAAACTGDATVCGEACVVLDGDRMNCGSCGTACPGGQSCRAGACAADLMVACYATDDLRPVTADLESAGSARALDGAPTALASAGAYVYSANGGDASSVAVLPLDESLATTAYTLTGSDLEGIAAYGGVVLVSNAATNTLVALDPGAGVLDEWALGDHANPHGIAAVGSTVYVALYGQGPNASHAGATGQAVAKLDLSDLPRCVAGEAERCGALAGTIDLGSVAGAADAGAYPFPHRMAVRGTRLYVTLPNLARASSGYYSRPAGDGRLAVIETADDSVSIVDLGAACKNPGSIAISGATAWVACGSYSFSDEAPGALLPVDLSGPAPAVGAAIDASSIAPGSLVLCGGKGYVGDQWSGKVVRFDLETRALDATAEICPTSTAGWAWAADLTCPAE